MRKDAYESLSTAGQPLLQTARSNRANLSSGQKIVIGVVVVAALVAIGLAVENTDFDETDACALGVCVPKSGK